MGYYFVKAFSFACFVVCRRDVVGSRRAVLRAWLIYNFKDRVGGTPSLDLNKVGAVIYLSYKFVKAFSFAG